jgi:hypothetical protein
VAIYHAQPRLLAAVGLELDADRLPYLSNIANVAMTTWETSDFPPEFANPLLNAFGGKVIVPSEFCAQVIGDRIDRHGMHVVPHTFDPNFWRPRPRPPSSDSPLRFYTLGAWSERKNHLGTVAAYLHAFTRHDNVELYMPGSDDDQKEVRSLCARSGMFEDVPSIRVMVNGPMNEAVLVDFVDSMDVFCSSSRGEGWGLPLFEAAAMGKTIISPCVTGERDFMGYWNYVPDLEHGSAFEGRRYGGLREVNARRTPCFWGRGKPTFVGGQLVGEKASAVPGQDCKQTWFDVDVVDMAERMRGVYHQHQAGNLFTVAADRDWLAARFGYDVVARRLITALEELST